MEDSLEKAKKVWRILIQELLERVQKLEIKNENLEKRIAVLEKEITSLKIENDILQARIKKFSAPMENNFDNPPTENLKVILSKKENPLPQPQKTICAQRATNTINEQKNISADEDFIKEYNHLMNKTGGFEKSNARKNFIAKYNVRFFNCVNFNERMNQPDLSPIFEENDSAQTSDYWAIPISGNTFKVVPNVKNYNKNYHLARAMGDVFNSNFDFGNYLDIHLEKAAEFTNSGQNWTLVRKGKLILR